jgi:hypothetical protein
MTYDLAKGRWLRFSCASCTPPIADIYTGINFDMLAFPMGKFGFENGVTSFGFLLCNAD